VAKRLQDTAILKGGTVITEEKGYKLVSLSIADLGQAARIQTDKYNTTIVAGKGNPEAIMGRIEQIKEKNMNKQSVRVIIGHEVRLTVPGMLGRTFDFKPGHSFLTRDWFYPGESYKNVDLAWTTRNQWSFGTNTGTDLPLIVDGTDVREVVIPDDPETIKVFKGAPFSVTIHDQQQ
jgi:hypothetical protein